MIEMATSPVTTWRIRIRIIPAALRNHEAKNQEGIEIGRIALSQSKVRQDADELSKKRHRNPTLKVICSTRPDQTDHSYNSAQDKPAGTPGN